MIVSKRKIVRLHTPLEEKHIAGLRIGDEVFLTGEILTARDQAHKRLGELIKAKKSLSVSLKNQVLYYCGPTKTPKGKTIGSCGPTTSSRMDKFTRPLLVSGLRAMIGKGRRSDEVRDLIKKHKAVYFLATGGAGAFLSKRVLSSKIAAFGDLGPEAIYRLKIKDSYS